MIRVGVAGAAGRLGRVACAAIEAAEDLTLASRLTRGDDLHAFLDGLDVAVDCTVYPATLDVSRTAVEAGVAPVIGASGWTDADLAALGALCAKRGVPARFVPNFSLGAVLMMRFAEAAARVLPRAEIIELHHDGKRDAPSGTAKATARRMRDAGAPDPAIHSVRLPGLVAHQEVIFGGVGETLTIRHDSLGRDSFAAGILAAIRAVRNGTGLTIGLDDVIDGMRA